jgi:lon-related putative ATP-dependent protease
MAHLVEELQTALSSAFESEEYQARRQTLEAEFQERQQESLKVVQERANERELTLLRTGGGLVFAPMQDGEVIEPDAFEQLDDEEKQRIQSEIEVMQEQLQKILYQVPRWEREFNQRLRELNQEVSGFVLEDLLRDMMEKYAEQPAVLAYLDAVKHDVIEHLKLFLGHENEDEQAAPLRAMRAGATMRRYQVNLLVDSSDMTGAPVIYESNPSYMNLIGRVEQMAQMGALLTDFTLIKPGVLHRANGGYLILDARKVLTNPYAWEGLKRALQFRQIRIESPLEMLSLTSTISLEPEPIPLDVKVIMMGDRRIYYLLAAYDEEFSELFKVAADFDDEFTWDEESTELYARLIATIAQREGLRPFDADAVARIIEQSARLVSDKERLTARIQTIVDLQEEADYWAGEGGAEVITAEHIQQAIDAQIYRADRVSERMQEEILRETILVDTTGEKVGQINGLSVLQLGNFAFGKPSRITAAVRMGKGDVVNIEREVNLSGPIHDKGVLILSSFLRARYAYDKPLALSASLVFEQSYGGVDGDSASSTELYALLSAIGEIPIRQGLAVTGSVNQLGEVQAIGGVNEKVEGFFDLCQARGLTGDQGVLIPEANVKHLMLRQDVRDAVAGGHFAVYPVSTIDEGIALLTGLPAGEADAEGIYPPDSVNRRVADKLAELSDKRIALDRQARASTDEDTEKDTDTKAERDQDTQPADDDDEDNAKA